jgi:hypothetical protein
VTLTPAHRGTFAVLAAVLIPGGEGMPGAADVDISGSCLDRVLAVRPTAAAELPQLLDRLAATDGPPGEVVRDLRANEPATFGLFSSVIVGAYFIDDTARASIGYPGQSAKETSFEDETGYLAEGLLDPVLDRGGSAPGS